MWLWEKVGGSSNLRILTPKSRPRWAPTVHPPPKSPTAPTPTYAQKSSPKHKLPPKTPPKQRTPPKVRSFISGREKFEKLLEFKKRLDQEQKSSLRPGPPHSTPSSPRQRIIRPPPTTPPHRPMPPPLMSVLVTKKKKRDPSTLRCRWSHHRPSQHHQ